MFAAALLIGGLVAFAVYGVDRSNIEISASARAEVRSAALSDNPVPDFTGYTLFVLCDDAGRDTFATARENETALSRAVFARDRHLTAETGVEIRVDVASDFLTAAREDLLSGDCVYQLYAADARGALAPLMVGGSLCDIAETELFGRQNGRYNTAVMEKLSVYGKSCLISPAAAGGLDGVYCVAYHRREAEALAARFPDGQSLTAAALDGGFTLELLTVFSRAAADAHLAERQAAAADETALPEAQEDYCGLALDMKSIFPLALGLGGGFIEARRGSLSVTPYATLEDAVGALRPLLADGTATLVGDAFGEGGSLFGVTKLGELQSLKATLGDVGLLPMPKRTAAEPYRCYLDLDGTPLFALPLGADILRTTYLIDRLAFLACGYVEPVRRQGITGGNADDGAVLSLIESSVDDDIAGLLGYGDIPSLYAAQAQEGDTAARRLEYYNRKALYEKALSIIEKRMK